MQDFVEALLKINTSLLLTYVYHRHSHSHAFDSVNINQKELRLLAAKCLSCLFSAAFCQGLELLSPLLLFW